MRFVFLGTALRVGIKEETAADLCVSLSPAFSPDSAEGPRGWEQGLRRWSQGHSQSCPCLLGTRLGLVKIESVDQLREGTELITQLETSGPTVPPPDTQEF